MVVPAKSPAGFKESEDRNGCLRIIAVDYADNNKGREFSVTAQV